MKLTIVFAKTETFGFSSLSVEYQSDVGLVVCHVRLMQELLTDLKPATGPTAENISINCSCGLPSQSTSF